jgi:hypothetical protein
MLELTGGSWFSIAGRGNVYACNMPADHEGSLLNQEVLIEGHKYLVTGVELQAVRDGTLYKGRPVGLLVRGPRKEDEGFTPYPC